MKLRTYTPILKIVSLTLAFFIFMACSNFNRLFIFGPFVLLVILSALQTYKIVLKSKDIIMYKLFSKELCIEGRCINKIELEAIRSGKIPSYRLYIYTDSRTYETSITWFIKEDLLKGLINFCATNNIEMDEGNY